MQATPTSALHITMNAVAMAVATFGLFPVHQLHGVAEAAPSKSELSSLGGCIGGVCLLAMMLWEEDITCTGWRTCWRWRWRWR